MFTRNRMVTEWVLMISLIMAPAFARAEKMHGGTGDHGAFSFAPATSKQSKRMLLKQGMRGDSVAALHALLQPRIGYDLPGNEVEQAFFGAETERAVRDLQASLGLKMDGIAGPILIENLTIEQSQKDILAKNWLDRMAAITAESRQLGYDKAVIINVPSFNLHAVDLEKNRIVLETPVIVGRVDRKTPLGTMFILGVKYNPQWFVPPKILREDIIPKMDSDPEVLLKKALIGVSPDGEIKSIAEVSTDDIASGWKIMQPAGKHNVLGRIKFETDSAQQIYLHDTNDHGLFERTSRAFSSGCIRVKDWSALAQFLTGKTALEIDKVIQRGATSSERTTNVPVYIEYSRVDIINGKAVAFPDVYNLGDPVRVIPASDIAKKAGRATVMN